MDSQFHIYIDTNIFVSAGFSFEDKAKGLSLHRIPKYCLVGVAKLILHPIILGEVRQNIISQENIDYRKTKKIIEIVKKSGSEELKKEIEKFEKTMIPELKWQEFRRELELLSPHYLDYDGISAKEIFQRYFHSHPPFGLKEAKKAEFPDAYLLFAIENYAKKSSKEVLVISEDKGWKNYLENNKKIKFFEKVNDVLNYIVKNSMAERKYQTLEEHSRKLIGENQEELAEAISKQISTETFNFFSICDGEIDEVEDVCIEEIVLSQIIEAELEADYIIVELSISFSAKIYAELEHNIWDSIDKKMIPIGYKKGEVDADLSLEVEVSIPYNALLGKGEFTFEILSDFENLFDFDEEHFVWDEDVNWETSIEDAYDKKYGIDLFED